MKNVVSFTRDFSRQQADSSRVARLAQSQALRARLADLDRVYGGLLQGDQAVSRDRLGSLVDRYLSAVFQACEVYCNGGSQEVRQVFRSRFQ